MKQVKHSNRGGALLSVVIVMAIAGILGALAISIAYTNFTMKVVDKKSKDNFYSAEKVLEEIVTGLEQEASDQYKEAYTYVMSKYNSYQNVAAMEEEFQTMFVINLIEEIQVTNNSSKYEIGTKVDGGTNATGMYQYVKDNYGTAVYTITSEDNSIDTLEDGICIRNLNVQYQDGNYHNTITTDIKISIPDVSFAMISAMPEIGEYSFIAEGGTDVSGNAGVDLVGKAYSGVGPTGTTNTVAITLNNGAKFDATDDNSVLLVSKGDVLLKGNSNFATGEKTAFWTDSITADYTSNIVVNDDGTTTKTSLPAYNVLDLKGRTYVKDDTTLNGTNNTLKVAGQYYGYSNADDDSSKSSSIIINGQTTTVDFSKLDTLLIAGTSYVSTKGSTYGTNVTSQNILMGDSVAIKSNQLAYLVPTECAGIVSNPMTYDQYEALPTDWKTQALNTYLSTIRSSLANYGGVDIVPVFEADKGTGGTVYLYLSFSDSEKASEYFMKYYGANGDKVNAFINNYLNAITFGTTDLTRVVTRGNYLQATATEGNKAEYTGSAGNVALSAQELANYYSSYGALCKKLITNESALSDDEKNKTVYENIVNEAKVQEFVANVTDSASELGDNISYSGKVVKIDGEDIEVIIVDNAASGTPYQVEAGHKKGILIATGDVNISGGGVATALDWDGLIICGGKLTVNGSTCYMKHNPDYIGKLMQLTCEVTTDKGSASEKEWIYGVLDFFTSGSNMSSSSSSDDLQLTDVRNCITYENYKSE